jgi:hypothetical protein
MPSAAAVLSRFVDTVCRLADGSTTTEETYYPALKDLFSSLLQARNLPFEVRTGTSERRETRPGRDRPDLAFYDGADFAAVLGEVKLPTSDLAEMAVSTDQNDQIGRYLSQTGIVLLTNVRSFGLLGCTPGFVRGDSGPVPPENRRLLYSVDFWASAPALQQRAPVAEAALHRLGELVEEAVTEFASIADPRSLARILARQARRAKADLPASFKSVQPLLDDYRLALGLSFNEEDGSEFFRSSLIQTAFYGLFAGWTVWHRAKDGLPFEWERMDRYLTIPFLGKLFYEFKHPDRLAELRLAPHLDRATATLGRVDRSAFFSRFTYPDLARSDPTLAAVAITYFYEPFLEAFDPALRKELGVWYTPPEVVRYQVRRIDQLLREELGCARGFADERVVVLDPCCGTGAYLLEVLRSIADDVLARGDDRMLAAEIQDAISRRVMGFEILTAPFVVSQLQVYLLLADLGVMPSSDRRPAIFLTNALTGWEGRDQVKLNFPELQEEHESARAVKRDAPIIVILGNPPYNRFAGAAMDEESDLVDHYKGIHRRAKADSQGRPAFDKDGSPIMVQSGDTLLYSRWGVRKQLLDDLYIRFFRLAEERIGEKAGHGIVSFISNSSYLTGRSHPLMRESLLQSFDGIWIDNMHGNRLASERTPWGESCETLFSGDSVPGIKVGTAISTFLRRDPDDRNRALASVQYRDFWGKAELKKRSLLNSLSLSTWTDAERRSAIELPEGPREYERIEPLSGPWLTFAPRDLNAGYEAWAALDELFPVSFQGINPNRGLDGSVLDTDKDRLAARMKDYFAATSFAALDRLYPSLTKDRARYDARKVWLDLKANSRYTEDRVLPYLLFPLDLRWIYYETEGKLLNERRPAFWENLRGNEFLVTVPQPRRPSETLPLLATCLVDLHVHDRGSVCFPCVSQQGQLAKIGGANLSISAWRRLSEAWRFRGDVEGEDARRLVSKLFRTTIAILHSSGYVADHRESLAQDWAHIPIPKSRDTFEQLAELGNIVSQLLDPLSDCDALIAAIIGGARRRVLGAITGRGAGPVKEEDLSVEIAYHGAAPGRWVERAFRDDEPSLPEWGSITGDLFINDKVYFSNIPTILWRFEIGGYPILKKWLGYRQVSQGHTHLSLAEVKRFRSNVHRLGALVAVRPKLDALYQDAATDSFSAEELGLRGFPEGLSPGPPDHPAVGPAKG